MQGCIDADRGRSHKTRKGHLFFVLFDPMKSEINRLYYSITEVSAMLGEEQHVLRYWEREFPQLKPQKNRAGNRIYGTKEIQILRVIQFLLRQRRYTVAGANEHLRQSSVDAILQEMQQPTGSHESTTGEGQNTARISNTDVVREIASDMRRLSVELRKRKTSAPPRE